MLLIFFKVELVGSPKTKFKIVIPVVVAVDEEAAG